MSESRGSRRTKQGVVVSTKMEKTAVVRVSRTLRHPKYEKVIAQSKKYYAHDEASSCQVGDEVTIVECRPMSKLKRWRIVHES
jgi:small subunit ribosomal protein S17